MKESYGEPQRFHKNSLKLIAVCDEIVEDYAGQGYRLTIRQLYYQLVARGFIENSIRSYDNIVVLMTNARLAGLIDWDAIEDRTRDFLDRPHWENGSDIILGAANSYHQDLWEDQDFRVFAVVEKEALAGVLHRVCYKWDVPLLPARGYPSATSLREFAKGRIMGQAQEIVVLHLGDHDPSGIDMSRDLIERLELFTRSRIDIDFRRIALNMQQVEELKPPPNPAKVTDSRYFGYRQRFGDESWELDALPPQYIHELVETNVKQFIDFTIWDKKVAEVNEVKAKLRKLADKFDELDLDDEE